MTAIDPQQAEEEAVLTYLIPEKPSQDLINAMLAWRSTTSGTGSPGMEDMMRRIYTAMRNHVMNNHTRSY